MFDGTSPPYTPASLTNPVNLYGRTKRDGELAVLGVVGSRSVVLRVPVLYVSTDMATDPPGETYLLIVVIDIRYGPAPNNSDTAVNVLLDIVADQSGKTYKMDHYATRYPTNVLDIADFLVRLAGACQVLPLHLLNFSTERITLTITALPATRQIPPIIHYSAEEPFTKYEMCLVFAKLLGLPHEHIIPDAEPPQVRDIPLKFPLAFPTSPIYAKVSFWYSFGTLYIDAM